MPGMVLETGYSDVLERKEGTVIIFRAAHDTRLHVSMWGCRTASSSAIARKKNPARK